MPNPPFAVISDIHSNLEAAQAVFEAIRRAGYTEIVCLGDIVGYGPDPEAVVDLVMQRCGTVVAGNHDWALIHGPIGFNHLAKEVIEHTRDRMQPKFYHVTGHVRDRWHFLESLPERIDDGDCVFVHGSPRDPLMDYVFGDRHHYFNPVQLEEIFPQVQRLCFVGHTHFPVVIREDGLSWYPRDSTPEFAFEKGRKYIVNVGSVGQPRDGDPRAGFVTFTGDRVRFHRVVYDVEETRRKIIAADAHEKFLGDRLVQGK